MVVVDVVLTALAGLLLVPIAVLAVQCLAALLPAARGKSSGQRPPVVVLIPAHDEESVIGQTLHTLMPQLQPADRVLVVADNCTDGTAAAARHAGAQVIERHDPQRRGKGYAIDYGVRHLEQNPPAVLVLVDADCQVEPGAIDRLAREAVATGRPVQALYRMDLPADPSAQDRISAFAFCVKNVVRPKGQQRLGFGCFLTGTGMAFEWPLIRQAALASGNIVEDMQLGIDLAIEGHVPLLCEAAEVQGRLPGQRSAAVSQRTRWEHGHLQTIGKQVPRLVAQALAQGRAGLLAMALDLCVPPLSFLVMLWCALSLAVVVGWVLGGARIASAVVVVGWVLLVCALLAAWTRFAREILPARSLAAIPLYVLRKVPLYLAFWRRRQAAWVRTGRDELAVGRDQRGQGRVA